MGGNCERAGELEFWDGEGALKVQAWGEVGEKERIVETSVPGRLRGDKSQGPRTVILRLIHFLGTLRGF